MEIALTVTAGPHEGQKFAFSGHDRFVVGRSPRANFQLADKDKFLSQMHFMIEVNPPLCRLIDLGSNNGTFLNGKRVKECNVIHGDEIKAGHTFIKVAMQGVDDESTADDLTAPVAPVTDYPDIPGYRIERELGRGAMGIVYQAVKEVDGATVAIKTIRPAVMVTEVQFKRFLREAHILSELEHKYIIRFLDMGNASGQLFFAMEFVDGIDAGCALKENGPFPIRAAVRLVCQLLKALAYAHEKGFVHRDIKPSNLLIATEENQKRIRVADFGLARVYQSSQISGLTTDGTFGGTLGFMPPEQILEYRSVKPAGDQYSAAATLYNLLTGKLPWDFPKSIGEQIGMILDEEPIPIRERRKEIDTGLAEAIHRAMAGFR